MSRIRTLIVDDEPLARARIADLLGESAGFEVIGECGDGSSAVSAILRLRPDLVFLDVQMPELDGFDVLQALADEPLPAVVFVTAYDKYALRAFDVHAVDYLLKPIDPARFALAVKRATEATALRARSIDGLVEALSRDRPERFVARSGSRFVLLSPNEIEWIEAAGNYLRLGTERGACLLRSTMKSMLTRLDPQRFLQVHRSLVINTERISSLEPLGNGQYEVRLQSGRVCSSSRSHSGDLRKLKRK